MSNKNETPSSSSLKITIKTADNEVFKIDKAIAMQFSNVKHLIDHDDEVMASSSATTIIPLPNVKSDTLANLIDYCNCYVEFNSQQKEMKAYGEELLNIMYPAQVFDIMLAAHNLGFKEALDFFSDAVADHIENKSVNFVRRYFGIKNDFSPDEEEELRRKNDWAFEGIEEN
jgi:S-phase kinase-associated protein 1